MGASLVVFGRRMGPQRNISSINEFVALIRKFPTYLKLIGGNKLKNHYNRYIWDSSLLEFFWIS